MNNSPSQQREYRLSTGLSTGGFSRNKPSRFSQWAKGQHSASAWRSTTYPLYFQKEANAPWGWKNRESQNQIPCSSFWSPTTAMEDAVRHSLFSSSGTLICLIPFRLVCGSCHSQVPLAHLCHQMVPLIPLLASHLYYQLEHPLKGALFEPFFSGHLNFLFASDLPWFTDSSVHCNFETRENS